MMTTVIGLGHVGTVAAAGLASAGHDVLGVDVDRQRVAQLGTWHAADRQRVGRPVPGPVRPLLDQG